MKEAPVFLSQEGKQYMSHVTPDGTSKLVETPVLSPTEKFMAGASPFLNRYLNIMRMAQDEDRPQERRDALKQTALNMLSNTTNIEGVSFMPPQEHTKFMEDLTTHGGLVSQEVKAMGTGGVIYERNREI